MQMTLRKFSEDPYTYIKKAPLTIYMGNKPRFRIIPINKPINKGEPEEFEIEPQKPRNFLLRLLFN